MARCFNTTGACDPQRHYMVDISERLAEIRKMVDAGKYFTINRARQYGKTTTLQALANNLKKDYVVLSLDFQKISSEDFLNGVVFSKAFVEYLLGRIRNRRSPVEGLSDAVLDEMSLAAKTDSAFSLRKLFDYLSDLCDTAEKSVVLMIDEVDSAANNQVFLDFLSQLRFYFLNRDDIAAFQSVILAGVYDVKNIRRKIRPEGEHKVNSPWNIAADFEVAMSLSKEGIEGMLKEYGSDRQIEMNTAEMAERIYEYTAGYPFLVSRICWLIDKKVMDGGKFGEKNAWTKAGFLEALKLLLMEKNTLFESLIEKLQDYPELKQKLYAILFGGKKLIYNPDDFSVDIAMMFGFVKNDAGTVETANRIFEMRLYNYFLTVDEAQNSALFACASDHKPEFIKKGRLDMELVLRKFVEHFDSIYGDNPEEFDEEEGRRRFLLYLRPIINGTGNYYIEARTRNSRRMDVVVDFNAERFVIELKIWRGNAYHERGEEQLSDYLDYFHLKKGYMLSYNFNQKKTIGIKEVRVGDRILVEAVV